MQAPAVKVPNRRVYTMKAADARTSFERIMETPPGFAYAKMTRHHSNMVVLQAIGLSAAEKLLSVMTHEPGAPTAIDFGNPKELAIDVLKGAIPIAAKDMFTQQVRPRWRTARVWLPCDGRLSADGTHRANPL
jgi:hypothetical protein